MGIDLDPRTYKELPTIVFQALVLFLILLNIICFATAVWVLK